MAKVIWQTNIDLKEYRFSQVAERLQSFTRDDLADWYLEVLKFDKGPESEKVLSNVIINILKLWHPYIPFVTEVVWGNIFEGSSIMKQKYPTIKDEWLSPISKDLMAEDYLGFEKIKELIISIRNARSHNKVEPSKKVKAIIFPGTHKDLITSQVNLIKSLRTGIEEVEIKDKTEEIKNEIHVASESIDIYLIGAIDQEKEAERIKKEIANLEKVIGMIKGKLSNDAFVKNAPEAVVSAEKEKLAKAEEELNKLK